jgi:hypothetical protein
MILVYYPLKSSLFQYLYAMGHVFEYLLFKHIDVKNISIYNHSTEHKKIQQNFILLDSFFAVFGKTRLDNG